uniref:Ribonucleoside-diphosphate reductase large subunit n=1 Tax=Cercopithecine herpesvirus 1 TaxID=10325 RepID=Q805Z0_CHV1|nr:iibonucleotide reductase large subunit [Macacine alphaherpesvirus 1]
MAEFRDLDNAPDNELPPTAIRHPRRFLYCDRASGVTVTTDGTSSCRITNSRFVQCGSHCAMVVDGAAAGPREAAGGTAIAMTSTDSDAAIVAFVTPPARGGAMVSIATQTDPSPPEPPATDPPSASDSGENAPAAPPLSEERPDDDGDQRRADPVVEQFWDADGEPPRPPSTFPVPLELNHKNAAAMARFLGDAGKRDPSLLLNYFCRCAREKEERRAKPQTFAAECELGYREIGYREFGLLRYAIYELQRMFVDVPPMSHKVWTSVAFVDYVTQLVNKFKPLVRRSDRLYRLLGMLVHLRIRARSVSFEAWMRCREVGLDDELVEQLRAHESQLVPFFEGLERGPTMRLMERGLQSALKYEEFYLKSIDAWALESVPQMYTRIAGHLACHSDLAGRVVFGRDSSWLEMFTYFFTRFYGHEIVPSTPAMLGLGTRRPYMSSCYLVNPQTTTTHSTLAAITQNVGPILARSGGIGLCLQEFNDARRGNASIMPTLKALDSLVAAYNNQSLRPTGVTVYLEPWHSDIMAVLRMKGVLAGEESRRCDNIFSALWMPDLFFKRLIRYLEGEKNVVWTLFTRRAGLSLSRFHGEEFETLYVRQEENGFGQAMPIQDLAYAIVRAAATTGSPFVMFKDAVNRHYIYDTQGSAIAGSNLCTEIVHPANATQSGVCNLASVNLAECVVGRTFDFNRLRDAVRACVLMVNIMIDRTAQPTPQCRRGHDRLRSMGIGMQGLHTACLKMGLDLASEEFRELNRHIAEVMLLAAMQTSNALCFHGARPFHEFKHSMFSAGRFHWEGFPDARPRYEGEWERLRQSMMKHGLRNSQFIALMPTVASAQIADVSEGFAPLFTNMFSKVTRDGETLRPNTLLLQELRETFSGRRLNEVIDGLDAKQWSVEQALPCLAADHPLRRFKTAFEYDQELLIDLCADRAPYVDHSQSLTLYVTERADGTLPASVLVRLLVHAYKRGLKTGMYYCKVRKATNSGVFGGDDNIVCTSCVL